MKHHSLAGTSIEARTLVRPFAVAAALGLLLAAPSQQASAQVSLSTTTLNISGNYPKVVVTADFNHDGKMDLVTGNYLSANASILFGDGAGGFSGESMFPVGGIPDALAVGDMNLDGHRDLVVVHTATNNVSILLGNGSGGFAAPTNYAAGVAPQSVAVADFNEDGFPDLAVTTTTYVPAFSDGIVFLLLGGPYNFTNFFELGWGFGTANRYATKMAVDDLDNDGSLDLVVVSGYPSSNPAVSVFVGDGYNPDAPPLSGWLALRQVLGTGGPNLTARDVATGEFNGDGIRDIAILTYDILGIEKAGVTIYLGEGSGGWFAIPPTHFEAQIYYPTNLVVRDFNGDGKADIAISGSYEVDSQTLPRTGHEVAILLGNGLGGFAPGGNFGVGVNSFWVAGADFNADGKPDLVTANAGTVPKVSILLNAPPTLPSVSSPRLISLGATTATLGGFVSSDNGALVSQRGLVYSLKSTNPNPVIGGTGVVNVPVGGTLGVLSAPISGLTANVSYSFKAYATNSLGTTYTAVSSFITGGIISGHVTSSSSGLGINNVTVNVYSSSGTFVASALSGFSGTIGDWSIPTGLPAGTYYVRTANAVGYVNRLYNNLSCVGGGCSVTSGTPVTIVAGAATPGIDFALDVGGTVSGVVTSSTTGLGVPGVAVTIFTAGGSSLTGNSTDGSGAWAITQGLPTGSYRARTGNSLGYVNEIYSNIASPGTSTSASKLANGSPIAVVAGSPTSGVNFALDLGGTFSGVVTSAATGLPISGMPVEIYNGAGSFVIGTSTNGSGVWQFTTGIPVGTYFARTGGSNSYINEIYSNIASPGPFAEIATLLQGTPITASAGVQTGGLNFALDSGGGIAGVVNSSATSLPIAFAGVSIYSSSGAYLSEASANASGVWSILGLPAGSYYARTRNFDGFVDEIYDGISSPGTLPSTSQVTSGSPISVAVGSTTGGVVFALDAGGTISGSVTSSVSGLPLPGVKVAVYSASGVELDRATTNNAGAWRTFSGLTSGAYHARTFGAPVGYVNEMFDNLQCPGEVVSDCDISGSTVINLVAGSETSGVSFVLSPPGAPNDMLWRHPVSGNLELFSFNGSGWSRTASGTQPPAWRLLGRGDFDGNQSADTVWRHSDGSISLALTGGSSTGIGSVPDPAWRFEGIGDLNGDGKADMLWRYRETGDVYAWMMDGVTVLSQVWVGSVADAGWQIRAVADLNGDGQSDVLWRHETTGQVYGWIMNGTTITSSGLTTPVPEAPNYWQIVAVRDMNGDGKADVVWRGNAIGNLYVWFMNGLSQTSEAEVVNWPTESWDVMQVEDVDGDGKGDVAFHDQATGDVVVWKMDGVTVMSQWNLGNDPDLRWDVASRKPLGDGKSDLVWWYAGSGHVYQWLLNGTYSKAETGFNQVPDTSWQIEGVGDVNGDGRDDLVWRHQTLGLVFGWVVDGLSVRARGGLGQIADPTWRIVAMGDVDGDGRDDLVWRNDSLDDVYVWQTNGLNATTPVNLGSRDHSWVLVGVADVDADGKDDFVWHQTSTGTLEAWLMNGVTHTTWTIGSQAAPWSPVTLADVNGDGRSDVVWRNGASGDVAIWLLASGSHTTGTLPLADLGWSLKAVGDANGDGKQDLVWRHGTSGVVYVWLMNGATTIGEGPLGPAVADGNWKIVGTVR